MVTASLQARSAMAAGLLKPFWLCEGLSAADLERLAHAASFRSMDRGEVLINYGGDVRHVYCVLSGLVKLLVKTGRRKERIFELVGTGQTFGEGLIAVGRPSAGRAVAIEEGRLLLVPSSVLIDLLDGAPGLAMRWLRRVGGRIGHLLAELEADTGQSAAQRIIRWLIAKVGGQAGETRIRLDFSKATLAASLNTTPETFSRVLRHLREQGVLRVEGQAIVVPSPARLRYLQPCVFCGKPSSGTGLGAPPSPLDWERLAASRSECEVPHWFGTCDCDVPHWCGGTGRLTGEALAPRVPALSAGQVPTDDADRDNG